MEFWFRRESQAQRQHHHHHQQQQQPCIADAFGDDVVALAVEKGSGFYLGGEDFMVDDLLDLGELETEQEEEEEEEDDDEDDERHKETQQGGLGQGGGGGGGGERGKEIVGVEVGEDNKKPGVSFEPEATPSSSPVSELSLPMHDGAELEWVSRIVDDSLSEFPTPTAAAAAANMAAAKAPNLLVERLAQRQHQPPPVLKSKRSKRARTLPATSSSSSSSSSSCSYSSSPSSWGGGAPLLLLDALPASTSSSSSCSSPLPSSPPPSLSSRLILAQHLFDHIPSLSSANTSSFLSKQNQLQNNPKMLKSKSKKKKKKRGRKPKAAAAAAAAAVHQGGKGERRCSHCGVNKTPQWRAGPEGAKTLCNACGVRYKSGRLLPEYRPACSPTFISHIHSNSHRKVMEMRRSKEPQEGDDGQEAEGQDRFLLISSVA